MTPMQEVRHGLKRPNNRGCWLCDNYLLVKAGERQWKKNKHKICRLAGKILFSMEQCPLADVVRVE